LRSNVALRSRRMRMVRKPESPERSSSVGFSVGHFCEAGLEGFIEIMEMEAGLEL